MARGWYLTTAVGWGMLAASAAWAACTPEQAVGLRAAGFGEGEVDRVCAALQPPGAGSGAPGAAMTDGVPFAGAGIEPELGDDGVWRKYLKDGAYVLQNKLDAGSGYILFAETEPAEWREFRVKVRFTHEPPHLGEGLAGAALVYETGATGGDAILYTLQADGTVTATHGRGDGSFVALASRKDAGLAVADLAYVELGVRRRGDGATEFLVNGRGSGLTAPGGSGRCGLAAFGIGSYEFRDFAREG